MTRMPRDPDTLPPTMPTDHGDLHPSKAEYHRAAEAATEMGADAQRNDEGAGSVIWGFIAFLVALFCAAVVLDSLPTPDQLKQLLVSQGILEQVKASTDSRICHEALGTDEESHVRPMRSVRGT